MGYKEENKIPLKTSKVDADLKWQKDQDALKQDMTSFFQEQGKSHTHMATGIKQKETEETLKREAAEKQEMYMSSQKIVPIDKKYSPMFNQVFLTAKRNKTQTDSGLWLPSATLVPGHRMKVTDAECDFESEQFVMSRGPQVQQAKVGMEVKINFENFRQKTQQSGMRAIATNDTEIVLPLVTIDGQEYLKISERDIDYIVNNNHTETEE